EHVPGAGVVGVHVPGHGETLAVMYDDAVGRESVVLIDLKVVDRHIRSALLHLAYLSPQVAVGAADLIGLEAPPAHLPPRPLRDSPSLDDMRGRPGYEGECRRAPQTGDQVHQSDRKRLRGCCCDSYAGGLVRIPVG